MTRPLRPTLAAAALLGALALLVAAPVRAQEAEPVPEEEAPAPDGVPTEEAPEDVTAEEAPEDVAAEEPPADEGPPAAPTVRPLRAPGAPADLDAGYPNRAGPWAGPDEVQLRVTFEDRRYDLEVDHLDATALPFGTRGANRRLDYDTRMTYVRMEAAYGLGLGDAITLELHGGLGVGATDLSFESKRGSDFSGNGRDFSVTAESQPVDFNLATGFDLRAYVTPEFFLGGGYELTYARLSYDNEVFFADVVDGRQDTLVHDVHLQFGGTFGVVTFWAGFGFLVYWADLDLDSRTSANRWEVQLGQGSHFFQGLFGVALHPGQHLSVTIEGAFVPDPSLSMTLGWAF